MDQFIIVKLEVAKNESTGVITYYLNSDGSLSKTLVKKDVKRFDSMRQAEKYKIDRKVLSSVIKNRSNLLFKV